MKLIFDKKMFTVTVLLILLASSSFGLSAYAAEIPADVDPAKTLDFLKDVIQLDTEKYTATLTAGSSMPYTGGTTMTSGQYVLESAGSDGYSLLTVTFNLWDKTLFTCSYYENSDGVTFYLKEPEQDLRKAASGILQRYQTYTGDKQVSKMIGLLEGIDLSSDTTKTDGTLQLTVEIIDDSTYLTWGNTVNGADYSRLILQFENNEFSAFLDDRAVYSLGSSEVTISKEQAVNIALEQLTSYTYKYGDEEISNFAVVKEQILLQPNFLPKQADNPLIQYPCWIVDLPLSEMYPGSVSLIRVMLWADTGDVISVTPLGYGSPDDYPTDNQIPPPTAKDSNSVPGNIPTVYIIGACIAIIIPIAITAIVLKRRKK
jgi:hypothetical protein